MPISSGGRPDGLGRRTVPSALRELFLARRPAYATLQSVGAEAVVLGLNFATGVVTARLLGAEGRGVLGAVTLWQLLLALAAASGVQTAVVYALRRSPQAARDISAAALAMLFVTCTAAIVAGFFALPLFLRQYPDWTVPFARACLAVVYLNAAHVIFKQVFSGTGRFQTYNLASLLPPAVYLAALAALTAAGGGLTTQAAAAALAASAPVTILLLLPAFRRAARPRWTHLRRTVSEMRPYALRAAGSDLVTALGFLDRVILLPLASAAEFGLYIVAYSFSRIILVVQPAINSVLFSNLTQRAPAEAKLLHDRAFRIALYGLGLGAAALALLDRTLLSLVFGPEFAAAAGVFLLLSVEAVASVLVNISLFLFMAVGRPGIASTCQGIGLGVSTLVMIALVPSLGAYGAAIGLLSAAAVKLVVLFVAMGRSGLGLPSLAPRRADAAFLAARFAPGRAEADPS